LQNNNKHPVFSFFDEAESRIIILVVKEFFKSINKVIVFNNINNLYVWRNI